MGARGWRYPAAWRMEMDAGARKAVAGAMVASERANRRRFAILGRIEVVGVHFPGIVN